MPMLPIILWENIYLLGTLLTFKVHRCQVSYHIPLFMSEWGDISSSSIFFVTEPKEMKKTNKQNLCLRFWSCQKVLILELFVNFEYTVSMFHKFQCLPVLGKSCWISQLSPEKHPIFDEMNSYTRNIIPCLVWNYLQDKIFSSESW